MVNKLFPQWGQRTLLYPDGKELRVVMYPDVPENEYDTFLAKMFSRSLREARAIKMYSRWLSGVADVVRSNKHEIMQGSLDAFIIRVNSEGDKLYCPIAYTAIMMALTKVIIEDTRQLHEVRICTMKAPDDSIHVKDHPGLIVLLQKSGTGLFDLKLDSYQQLYEEVIEPAGGVK